MNPLDHTYVVIMAGGVGARFWPMSRRARPKQLVDLFGEGSMLRQTFDRLAPLVPAERQLIVTGEILRDPIRETLPELPHDNILCEPTGRNTAAAIGWAALEVQRRDPQGLLAVLPADHYVRDTERYREVCSRAISAAASDRIVTLGIPPTRPETGYGYIRSGEPLPGPAGEEDGVLTVREFKEKPDQDTALAYLQAGDYLWNAGMFFLPSSLALTELIAHEPELMRGLGALYVDGRTPGEARLRAVYPSLPAISFDYAVMERTDRVAVIEGAFGWSDVGSWRTLYDFKAEGEASFRQGRVIELGGSGNVLMADGGGLVATVGVSDLVVVHTPDATLVCPREQAQEVRQVVDALKNDEGDKWL